MVEEISTEAVERALDVLCSDDVRGKVARTLAERGVALPGKYAERVAGDYVKEEKMYEGAKVFRQAGMIDMANGLYEMVIERFDKEGRTEEAARIANEAGMTDRARGLYEKAMSGYETDLNFENAERVAGEAGMAERAEGYRTLKQLLQ